MALDEHLFPHFHSTNQPLYLLNLIWGNRASKFTPSQFLSLSLVLFYSIPCPYDGMIYGNWSSPLGFVCLGNTNRTGAGGASPCLHFALLRVQNLLVQCLAQWWITRKHHAKIIYLLVHLLIATVLSLGIRENILKKQHQKCQGLWMIVSKLN